jgi:hypothetical protein
MPDSSQSRRAGTLPARRAHDGRIPLGVPGLPALLHQQMAVINQLQISNFSFDTIPFNHYYTLSDGKRRNRRESWRGV